MLRRVRGLLDKFGRSHGGRSPSVRVGTIKLSVSPSGCFGELFNSLGCSQDGGELRVACCEQPDRALFRAAADELEPLGEFLNRRPIIGRLHADCPRVRGGSHLERIEMLRDRQDELARLIAVWSLRVLGVAPEELRGVDPVPRCGENL